MVVRQKEIGGCDASIRLSHIFNALLFCLDAVLL